jgi:hypothetical protein
MELRHLPVILGICGVSEGFVRLSSGFVPVSLGYFEVFVVATYQQITTNSPAIRGRLWSQCERVAPPATIASTTQRDRE